MTQKRLDIPTPTKPFIKGKELFSREELKEIISYKDRLLDHDMLGLSPKMKFALIYRHSMYGKASFGIDWQGSKLNQKRIKEGNFPVLSDDEMDIYVNLYSYAHAAFYKEDEEVQQFVNSTFMSSSIFEVFDYLIIESLYDVTGVSFLEHIGEITHCPTNKDLSNYYNKRNEMYDPIRNNMLLFYIRNQNSFPDSFLRPMVDDYKSIEVLQYKRNKKKIHSIGSVLSEDQDQPSSTKPS